MTTTFQSSSPGTNRIGMEWGQGKGEHGGEDEGKEGTVGREDKEREGGHRREGTVLTCLTMWP